MAASGRAKVILDLKTGKFQQGLAKAKSSWKSFTGFATGALATAGITMGLQKLVSTGQELIDLSRTQKEAEAGVAAALLQRGEYTRQAFERAKEFAGAMQSVTKYGDEQTLAVERQLIQYGLLGDELEQATRLTLDAGAAGRNLAGTADLIGKAFKGEFGTLSRYGVIIGENVPKSEKFAEALKQMNIMWGGQAEALAKIDENKLTQIGNVWGDIKEVAGSGVAAALTDAANAAFGGAAGMAAWNDQNKMIMESGIAEALTAIGDSAAYVTGWLMRLETVADLAATSLKPILLGWDVLAPLVQGEGMAGVGAQLEGRYLGFIETWKKGGQAFDMSERLGERSEYYGARGRAPQAFGDLESMIKELNNFARNTANKLKMMNAEAEAAGG